MLLKLNVSCTHRYILINIDVSYTAAFRKMSFSVSSMLFWQNLIMFHSQKFPVVIFVYLLFSCYVSINTNSKTVAFQGYQCLDNG